MRLMFWIAGLILAVDQISKYYVVHMLQLDRVRAIDVLPPFFNLRMGWNYGINFGLFAGRADLTRWVLIGLALVISAGVIWWILREGAGTAQKIAAGVLVGGALGNVLDRLLYGAVADFINMSCCGINNPFTFNVADIAIFIGVFGLVLWPPGKKAA